MKKYRVNRQIPTTTIKVETVLVQPKFELKQIPVQRITVKRPYYQIRNEFGDELFATNSFDEALEKMDEYDEHGDYDYMPYIQDETYVDGVLVGLKNQRLFNGWY